MDQRERMKAEVERWRRSGLSQKEFCKELGMKVGTFAYWVSRNKESEKKKGFTPLVPPAGSVELIEVSYPNGDSGSLICVKEPDAGSTPVSRSIQYRKV